MDNLVACGVVERSADVSCAGGVVLVEGQKEGQKFRFCTDFREINSVARQCKYPLPDIPQIIDAQHGCDAWSILDLKSGFYNIPVAPHARKMLGIVMQDGMYHYCRMPMGVISAPGWF